MFLFRTVTNIAKKSSADAGRNANKENEASTSGCAGGGAGEVEKERLETEEAHNADNYDARQARKCTKKKDQVDAFQEQLLKAIEVPQPQVDVGPPPPPAKHEYLDVALEAMAFKMREVLSKEEIIDVVEDLENLVSRACRDKRHRMEMVKNPAVPAQHPLQEAQMYAGPQRPLAVSVPYHNTTGNSNDTTFYNFN